MSAHIAPARPGDKAESPDSPRIWVLIGEKLGDNAQVLSIAEALGLPSENKTILMRDRFRFGKPNVKPSLHHIDADRSAALEPPWPDLVITIGRRLSMVALWIKEQSGGRTRTVLVGRPRRMLDRFDLVVTAAHYRLPARDNVLRLDLPLMRVDEQAVEAAARDWAPRFESLKRPIIAMLVGGPTKPVRFDTEVAADLMRRATAAAADLDGTLYITTSRRTPPAIVDVFQDALPDGAVLHRWQPDGGENPYRGLLGLADCFIVTGDSISMMVEVARLGRPLAIFQQPPPVKPLQRWIRSAGRHVHQDSRQAEARGPLRAAGDALYRMGLVGYSRDLTALHELMFARGLAVPLGQPFPPAGRRADDELSLVVDRVRALL